MLKIIGLNIDKKLSMFSMIFMFTSILVIFVVSIYQASFDLSEFKTICEYDIVVGNYISETFQLIEIISILFLILLVELELFYNTDNFDSYFVSLKGRRSYFNVKIITYSIILFFYTAFVFLGTMIIYLIRFKDTNFINYFVDAFANYFMYFYFIFALSYVFLVLFKNYFSAMIVFLYYWIGKLVEEGNYIFVKPKMDFELKTMGFNTESIYVVLLIVILIFICKKIYITKDMKINS